MTQHSLLCPSCGHDFIPHAHYVELGPIAVDPTIGLTINGKPVHIRPSEAKMLSYLIKCHPTPASRDMIMNAMNWWESEPQIVTVIAHRLRKALKGIANVRGIEDGWGWSKGGCSYRLELLTM